MNRIGERTTQGFQSRPGGSFMSGKQRKEIKRQAGERVESISYQGEIQTTHTVERVGKGGDRTEIRLNNVGQILHC